MVAKYGISKVSNVIGILLILLVMVGGLIFYVSPHFGWRINGLRSGSMAPEMGRGALVVARPVKPADIAVGDIIVFRPVNIGGKTLLVHRVIGSEGNSPAWFTTKGDANPTPDPYPVLARNVEAKVVFHIPLLGFAVMFLDTPVGFAIAVALPGATLALMVLQSLFSELRKRKRSPDK